VESESELALLNKTAAEENKIAGMHELFPKIKKLKDNQ
jgi:hypothetical protein